MNKEIDRILFVSLIHGYYFHEYIVLNDGNFVEKFFADNEEMAIQIFRGKYER